MLHDKYKYVVHSGSSALLALHLFPGGNNNDKRYILLFQKYFFLEIDSLFSSYQGPLFDRLAPIGEQIES